MPLDNSQTAKDQRYCERQGITMDELKFRKSDARRAHMASSRGANSIQVREEKERLCNQLGVSKRGLRKMRRAGLV